MTNGIYTTSSVTDLNDVTSVGSGQIITSTERNKLNGIETGADVTDATNVTAAGAVMTSGNQTITGTKTFSDDTNIGGDLTLTKSSPTIKANIGSLTLSSELNCIVQLDWNSNNPGNDNNIYGEFIVRTGAGDDVFTVNEYGTANISDIIISGSNFYSSSTVDYLNIETLKSNAYMRFRINSTDVMRITSSGDVGIGTAIPSSKLDVNGTANISGNTTIGGTLNVSGAATFGSSTDNYEINVGIDNYQNNSMIKFNGGRATFGYDNEDAFIYAGNDKDISFRIYDATSDYTEPMKIVKASGQVNVINNLAVGGNTAITGSLAVGGNTSVSGLFTANAGLKINVQNQVNGGSSRGIYMWNNWDTGWGIYMGQSGGTRSLNNGSACAGYGFTSHAIRYRVNNNAAQGHIFENSAEECLMSIRGSDGNTFIKGNIYTNDGRGIVFGSQWWLNSTADDFAWYTKNDSNSWKYVGLVQDDRTGAAQMNFTGQHRTFVENTSHTDISNNDMTGLIVCANTNKYIKMSGGIEIGKNAITQNESLPVVSLSIKKQDKSCFGVISKSEDPEQRIDKYGAFCTPYEKEHGDTRVFINSVGEGAVWVSDICGNLESGDYITTSNIPGYGMKQESEFLANYTVAKITMDCDFNPSYQPIQKIMKDASGENILNEYQKIQWEDTEEYEYAYKIRYLDLSGNMLTKEEYDTKKENGENVHKAAYVGCTYHCG